MPRAGRAFGVVLMSAAVSTSAAAQSVTWHRFDPLVVPEGYTQPVLLEAAITGSPTRVALELNTGAIEMRDDGTGGDRRAGDGIYTASVPAATIFTLLQPDDVQRPFLGFLSLFNGTTTVFRGNIFIDVYSPAAAGTFAISQLAPDVQATSRLVNIVDPLYLTDGDVRRVARTFYRFYGDDFDFLNVIATPSRFANRTHSVVRNDVDGIGLERSDNSAQFGSGGRLRGYSQFPIPALYDGAGVGYVHETGHQWINYLSFGPFASGVPHWPVSSMATGTMGFSIGGPGGEGGDFRCDVVDDGSTVRLLGVPSTQSPVFNDFDLYLMGLLAPGSVKPQVVLTSVASPPSCLGQVYTGGISRVGVDAIIAAAGNRVPDATSAPRRFRAATILVSRDGLVSRETMWSYSWYTARAELESPTAIHEGFVKATGNPFFVATRGRATLDTLLSSDPDFTLQPAQPAVTVTKGAAATFRISAMPTRASFTQPVTFSCESLPSPLACSFSPAQVTPGSTGVDVTLTVTTAGGTALQASGVAGATLMAMCAIAAVRRRRRLAWIAAALILVCGACGGSKTPTTPTTPSTPTTPPVPSATIYTVTVVGTSGPLRHTALLTLTVQ